MRRFRLASADWNRRKPNNGGPFSDEPGTTELQRVL